MYCVLFSICPFPLSFYGIALGIFILSHEMCSYINIVFEYMYKDYACISKIEYNPCK